MTGRRVQILWRWKAAHVPEGRDMRWQFAAHGAIWGEAEAANMAAMLRSHGKQVRLLPVPMGKESRT